MPKGPKGEKRPADVIINDWIVKLIATAEDTEKLMEISQKAFIGVAVPEKEGLNQYLALPNKLFDYIHAGLPQVTVNYPEYEKINSQFEVAVLLDDISPKRIAEALNNLLTDDVLYKKLKTNCLKARDVLNWQQEEIRLLAFYKNIFG